MDLRKRTLVLVSCGLMAFALPARADGDRDRHSDGDGFRLGGTARLARDPVNPFNDVIRIDTRDVPLECSGPFGYENCPFGTVSRRVRTPIDRLDNMIEFKAFFVAPKSCFGGSPRVQLAIDLDGDGESDGNAHGNFGPLPFGEGCPAGGIWRYEDLTDLAPRWDVTQLLGPGEIPPELLGGTNPFLVPWDLLETIVGTFANHRVCTVALVDDAFLEGGPAMAGIAYYDLFSAGDATWASRDDGSGRGSTRGCGRRGHDDDRDDDHDRDGGRER
jgi:hypothetical protein